jgi:hypothetical protein
MSNLDRNRETDCTNKMSISMDSWVIFRIVMMRSVRCESRLWKQAVRDMGLKEERVSCERSGFERGDLRLSWEIRDRAVRGESEREWAVREAGLKEERDLRVSWEIQDWAVTGESEESELWEKWVWKRRVSWELRDWAVRGESELWERWKWSRLWFFIFWVKSETQLGATLRGKMKLKFSLSAGRVCLH